MYLHLINGLPLYIINFGRNCISPTRSVVYHHYERVYSLRLMICTCGDDIPLLSQWIKILQKMYPFLQYFLEQATGIEPARSAWEAEVLPLNHACEALLFYQTELFLSMLFTNICEYFFDIFGAFIIAEAVSLRIYENQRKNEVKNMRLANLYFLIRYKKQWRGGNFFLPRQFCFRLRLNATAPLKLLALRCFRVPKIHPIF